MDKKNNSGKIDNAKVFGMFANLRKNLNSPARDGAEAEKTVEKALPYKLPSQNAVKEAVDKDGFIGIFTGGLTASSGGIAAAITAGLVASLIFKAKDKS